MRNPSLNQQVSMLREMMCMFTCHSSNVTACEINKALGCLTESPHMKAAGIFWCDDGKLTMLKTGTEKPG